MGDQDNKTRTVLVVEDDEIVRMGVVEELIDHGFTVLEAGSANDALAILQSNAAIDLLITDIGLPGMDGRALALSVRAIRPTLRVLFLTGYRDADVKDEAWARTIEKPVEMRVLAMLAEKMSKET